jgi:hypothetical protein
MVESCDIMTVMKLDGSVTYTTHAGIKLDDINKQIKITKSGFFTNIMFKVKVRCNSIDSNYM